MNRKTTFSAIGGYQPFLFAIGMYFVALFFSIFICSAIFYAFNPPVLSSPDNGSAVAKKAGDSQPGSTVLLTVSK